MLKEVRTLSSDFSDNGRADRELYPTDVTRELSAAGLEGLGDWACDRRYLGVTHRRSTDLEGSGLDDFVISLVPLFQFHLPPVAGTLISYWR